MRARREANWGGTRRCHWMIWWPKWSRRTSHGIGSGYSPDMTTAPRRILVTGAMGFVGRHLTARLASTYPDAAVLMPPVDIREAETVAAAIRETSPDVCIHLAAVS